MGLIGMPVARVEDRRLVTDGPALPRRGHRALRRRTGRGGGHGWRDRGEDAAGLVHVEYEPLPAVIGVDNALADRVLLFPECGTNLAFAVIAGATHESLIADQRDAAATTRAVLDVVTSVRTQRPLIN